MKLLIVGLGSMGKRRARLIARTGAHTLCGVDAAEARRAEAEGLGIAMFESLEAALAATRYDAAFVCTAPLSHADIIGALLDAGLPVFTELNLVADGYDELISKAAQKGLPLFLSSTMLYRAETQEIARRVAAHGRPLNYVYHIGQYLPDWHPWESYKDFFVGDTRTGGVREIFGIELPWLWQAFGPARLGWARGSTLSALGLPYDDSIAATLTHQGGHTGLLAVDVVSPKAVRNLEVYGEGLQLFWAGNPASLFEFDVKSGEKQPIHCYEAAEQDARYSDNIVENAYLEEILNFFDVLAGKAKPRWDYLRDARVLALMDAIEAAAKSSQEGATT